MSFQTTANPDTTRQQASAPALRLLQVDELSPSQFSDTVSLFSGSVLLSLKLATLVTPGGLQAEVSITYQSNAFDRAARWNLEAPTGPLGLGWSLHTESILRDTQGSVAPFDDLFYLALPDGSRSRLYPVTTSAGLTTFQDENFQYQQIVFDAAADSWTITDAQGVLKTFGGVASARQQAVCWGDKGDWIGNSCMSGQSTITLAWNLSRLERGWADAIDFQYENDMVALGSDNPALFTRASYLSIISDGTGRAIRLSYAEKQYDDEVREYQPPNTVAGSPLGGFQDRYETRFLQSVMITQTNGEAEETLSSIQFLYTLMDCNPSADNPRDFTKRLLTALVPIEADGRVTPALKFTYYEGTEPDSASFRGGLASVRYPTGSVGHYKYAEVDLPGTQLRTLLTDAATGSGLLRTWFGGAYAAIMRYDEAHGRRLVLTVQDWNGRWLSSPRLFDELLPGELDLSSLSVTTFEDWFLFVFRTTGQPSGPATRALAMRRRWGTFGTWDCTELALPPLVSPTGSVDVVAGSQFVAAAATDQQTILRYSWNSITKAWIPAPLQLTSGREFVLASRGSYFTVCGYDPSSNTAELTIHRLDTRSLTWRDASLSPIAPILWEDDLPKLQFALADSFAAATYLTSKDVGQNTVTYSVLAWSWDRDLEPTATYSVVPGTTVPADSVEPFFLSVASHSQLGNVGNLWRWSATTWVSGSIGGFNQGQQLARFIYDDDFVLATNGVRNAAAAFQPALNGYSALAVTEATAGPDTPTLTSLYGTLGSSVYLRTPDRGLQFLNSFDSNFTQIANPGTGFLLVGVPGLSQLHTLRDGVFSVAGASLQGQAFAQPSDTGSGTSLVSGVGFITYQGPSLSVPGDIYLHHVVRGAFSGPLKAVIVSAIAIDDGFEQLQNLAFRYLGDAVAGPYDLGAEFTAADIAAGTADFTSTPNGYRRSHFYNSSLPEDGDDPNPAFPSAMLNGILRGREDYDSQGRLVARLTLTYQVATSFSDLRNAGASQPLAGGNVRLMTSTSTTFDPAVAGSVPLIATSTMTYDDGVGQPATRSMNNYRLDGSEETVVDRWVYGPAIYPTMLSANVLGVVVQKSTEVDGNVVSIEATTYSDIWDEEPSSWAVRRTFIARVADAILAPSDWNNTTMPPSTAWKLEREVRLRGTTGRERESWKAGVTSSTVLDTSERLKVAEHTNASLYAGDCAYFGCESYEHPGPWTLGGTVSGLINAIASGDCHTGTRAIVLAGGAASPALAATMHVTSPRGGKYLFAVWVKSTVPATLAAWTITTPMSTQSLPVPATPGVWTLQHAYIDLPASTQPQTVVLCLSNLGTGTLLVDELCFSPALGSTRVQVFDPVRLDRNAAFRVGGAVARELRDTNSAILATTQTNTEADRVAGRGLALSAPLTSFSISPNLQFTARPRTWSLYQSFLLGLDWLAGWTTPTQAAWSVSAGCLRHSGTTLDAISHALPAAETGATVQFRVQAPASQDVSFGVGIGEVRLLWSIADAGWRLTGPGGVDILTAQPGLAVLPAAAVGELDAGSLSSATLAAFHVAGLPAFAATCQVVQVTHSSRWMVTETSSGTDYIVAFDGGAGGPVVMARPRVVTALVSDMELVLFSDGLRCLSWRASQAFLGALQVLAGGNLAIDRLVLAGDTMLEVDHLDGLLVRRQRQVGSEDGPVAIATVTDDLARAAITSQGAFLAPTADKLYAYEPGLAQFDWSTLLMTGIVANQHLQSEGFAYARTRYEDRPTGREVERGLPGAAYAIAAGSASHTARAAYGLSDGSFGVPANQFLRQTVIDANGVATVTVQDLRGRTVATSVPSTTVPTAARVFQFDAASRLVGVQYPTGTADSFTYDFIGQMMSATRSGQGTTRYLYDSIGRMRFYQTAVGAAAPTPYIGFTRYDALSRPIFQGVWEHPWGSSLQPDDPATPVAAASLTTVYDGFDRPDLNTRGRVASRVSAHQVDASGIDDGFSATELFSYDVRGNEITRSLTIPAFTSTPFVLSCTYDLQNLRTSLQYPAHDGTAGTLVAWQHDRVGRAQSVWVNGNQRSVFQFDADGRLKTQHVQFSASVSETRQFDYAPPGWPSSMQSLGLSEAVTYASTAPSSSWNGAPSVVATAPRAGRPSIVQTAGYDAAGRLAQIGTTVGGVTTNDLYGYDANDNALSFAGARLTRDGDRLLTATENGATNSYSYDANGAATGRTASSASPALTLAFDRWSGLPLEQGIPGPEGVVLRQRYADGRCVVRSTTVGTDAPQRKLILHDNDGNPLMEIGASSSDTIGYVWSNQGLEMLLAGEPGIETFVVCDRQKSVRALLDTRGNFLAAFDYDAWGRTLGTDLPSALTDLRYLTRSLLRTGLYDFRARLYDPAHGGFMSPDPAHRDWSQYAYARGNPLLYQDPTGLFAFLFFAITMLVSLVAGAITAGVVIAERRLTGAKAAAVFFGIEGLSLGAGAASFAGGGLVTAGLAELVETTLVAGMGTVGAGLTLTGAGVAAGAALGAAIGSAQAAGQASLLGDDPADAARLGAISGAASGAVLGLSNTFTTGSEQVAMRLTYAGRVFVDRNALEANTRFASFATGALVGAAAAGVGSAAQGNDRDQALLDTLQGLVLSGLGTDEIAGGRSSRVAPNRV